MFVRSPLRLGGGLAAEAGKAGSPVEGGRPLRVRATFGATRVLDAARFERGGEHSVVVADARQLRPPVTTTCKMPRIAPPIVAAPFSPLHEEITRAILFAVAISRSGEGALAFANVPPVLVEQNDQQAHEGQLLNLSGTAGAPPLSALYRSI